jgi:Putative zinc-finger/WD40-like Beta Propeller Repeat
MSPWDRHAAYRELLARRLDAELSAAETSDLDVHLAACPACRTVAAEYVEQRHLFRSLPSDEPPRDLWARTKTALDHEVAHGVRHPSRLAFGVLASLGALLALVSTQSGLLPGLGQPRTAGATPFAVTPQPVAYITRQGDELTIYQTQVSELCPTPAYDCTSGGSDTTPLLRVDTNVDPSDLALGTDGSLVITGRDHDGHAIYSVLELPDASSPAAATGDATPGTHSPSPAITPRATPSASARTASSRPTPSSGASAPADTSPAATTDITPPPSPSEAPTPVPGHTRAILSNVIAAGAPAAWSPDGKVLAFSAMPADGSQGPDIYTWRPGEPAARPLTRDHRSWFASWVGARILSSHTARAVGKAGTPLPALETVLIDPTTHETRPVDLSGAWLPSVDPSGHYVIYFKGSLERAGAGLRAVDGKLILADWRGLDPYAETPAASDATTPTAGSPARATATGRAATPTPASSATASSGNPAPAASSRATATARASGGAAGSGAPTPSAAATEAPFTPFTLATPGDRIADWLVRWTADGSAYGLWVTRNAGSDTGVLLVAPTSPDGRVMQDLLPPTPALRAFSIGLGHAAWVAPMDAQDDELRVITWGPGGSGGVRLQQVGSGTLAF